MIPDIIQCLFIYLHNQAPHVMCMVIIILEIRNIYQLVEQQGRQSRGVGGRNPPEFWVLKGGGRLNPTDFKNILKKLSAYVIMHIEILKSGLFIA